MLLIHIPDLNILFLGDLHYLSLIMEILVNALNLGDELLDISFDVLFS